MEGRGGGGEGAHGEAANEAARRRRTPSKHAESIRELTKGPIRPPQPNPRNPKKDQSANTIEAETPPTDPTASEKDGALNCLLPSSARRLRLSIVIGKPPKPKTVKGGNPIVGEKQRGKDRRKERERAKEREREGEGGKGEKGVSLLDSLLRVLEQYKDVEENKKEDGVQKGSEQPPQSSEALRKEGRSRRDTEQNEKYMRFYEKYRALCDRWEAIEGDVVIL
jgi:hypothetical protein